MDEGNECGPVAHEQIVRVCNHGRVPLPQLLRLPPVSTLSVGAGRWDSESGAELNRAARVDREGKAGGKELDSGSILAPLMEKLMETDHVEEFVEQVSPGPGGKDGGGGEFVCQTHPDF